MDRKSVGVDFERESFVSSTQQAGRADVRWPGILLLLTAVAALGLLGYKFLIQDAVHESSSDSQALAQIDQRMAEMEDRLERIEQMRGSAELSTAKKPDPPAPAENTKAAQRPVYRISPGQQPPVRNDPPAIDPATAQKVAGLQQGLGDLQQGAAADRQAWQTTNDRLTDVSGQVGSQQVQILRSADELNQLLARTQRTAIPFELHRGADRQTVGPISFSLKSTNPKTGRYSLCAYVQESCLELKERNRYEVVQFVTTRYTAPLEVIATSVLKNAITGYLEVPAEKTAYQDLSGRK